MDEQELDYAMIIEELYFKQAMRRARISAGYTEQELATELGLLEETMYEYEQPTSELTLSEIRDYLAKCGATFKLSVVLPDA